MASYIPQVTDYIPEYQPFQPDYNFLNNILQRKQTQYDSNYKALSQTYGTLLNSPMLRKDNIEKRNEYFKLIDQDIKRISGLDLSLQQNVDAANAVFDSFNKNKDLVKDITYTKQYYKALEDAESYKVLCADPTKCNGQYWPTGVNAIKLKAEEFMKASKEEAMRMSPGEYVPFVNVQEKAVSYLNNLLSKGGDNGFGISSVTQAGDGMYQVTMKNGSLLALPYKDLLLNMFSKDSSIQEMYETQAYVTRKSFVKSRAEQLGGNEDAAEDEYFAKVNDYIQEAIIKAEQARKEQINKTNRKSQVEKAIKAKGTTGTDELADDYVASVLDEALSTAVKTQAEKTENIAKSIFFASDDRADKRRRVDSIIANNIMNKEVGDAAIRAALLTGGITKIEADPYRKAKYEADLQMRNQTANTQLTYDLQLRNQREKAIWDLSVEQAKADQALGGGTYTDENDPKITPSPVGAAAEINKLQEISGFVNRGTGVGELEKTFLKGYTDQLLGIISANKDAGDVAYAKETLKNIYKDGYDEVDNEFVDSKGNKIADYNIIINSEATPESTIKGYFNNAKEQAKYNRNLLSHGEFIKGRGKDIMDAYSIQSELKEIGANEWRKNNKTVQQEVLRDIDDGETKLGWSIYFRKDGSNLSKPEFISKYKQEIKAATGENISNDDAEDVYEDVLQLYTDGYNNSERITSIYNVPGLSKKAGYISAQNQIEYTVKSGAVRSDGYRGFMSAYDAAKQDQFQKYGIGIAGTEGDVGDLDDEESMLAQQAVEAFRNAIRTASTKEELERKIGTVSYQSVALSNPEYQRVTIKFNENFLKDSKGTSTKPTWADDPRINEGVTIYFKSRGHMLADKVKHNPIDLILAHKSMEINVPKGGNITLSKMDENGVIHASGGFSSVVDGKLIENDPANSIYNIPYDASTSGAKIYDAWKFELEQNAKASEAALLNKEYTMSPEDVIRKQQIFGTELQQNLTDVVLARFEANMKAAEKQK
jgi:hypothetical protein